MMISNHPFIQKKAMIQCDDEDSYITPAQGHLGTSSFVGVLPSGRIPTLVQPCLS